MGFVKGKKAYEAEGQRAQKQQLSRKGTKARWRSSGSCHLYILCNIRFLSILSMKGEMEMLQTLNARMNGKKLDGLSYFELKMLKREIYYGLNSVTGQAIRIKFPEYFN